MKSRRSRIQVAESAGLSRDHAVERSERRAESSIFGADALATARAFSSRKQRGRTLVRAGGSGEISRWWSEPRRAQPPDGRERWQAPRRVREKQPPTGKSAASPQIPFVVFHHPPLQHRHVFLLKRLRAEDHVIMQRKVRRGHDEYFSRSCRSATRLRTETGGCARSGSLHHRLISFEPPAR